MNKRQAQQLARLIESGGMHNVQIRRWQGDGYDVTYTDPKSGYSAAVSSTQQWEDKWRAANESPYLD